MPTKYRDSVLTTNQPLWLSVTCDILKKFGQQNSDIAKRLNKRLDLAAKAKQRYNDSVKECLPVADHPHITEIDIHAVSVNGVTVRFDDGVSVTIRPTMPASVSVNCGYKSSYMDAKEVETLNVRTQRLYENAGRLYRLSRDVLRVTDWVPNVGELADLFEVFFVTNRIVSKHIHGMKTNFSLTAVMQKKSTRVSLMQGDEVLESKLCRDNDGDCGLYAAISIALSFLHNYVEADII